MEEISTYITDRVDVDVVLGIGWMRYERLDKKLPEHSLYGLDLLRFSRTFLNPSLGFWPCLVQSKQSTLAAALDQLIWFCYKFRIFC